MKTKSILLAGLIAFSMMFMSTCGGDVSDSEEAVLTIDFQFYGTEPNQSTKDRIVYKIDIDGAESLSEEVRHGENSSIKLITGNYEITVTAYLDNIGGSVFGGGYAEASIKPGPNPVPITIYQAGTLGALTVTHFGNLVSGTTYTDTLAISLTTAGGAIHYTLNGTEPTSSSQVYTGPIPITTLGNTTLKARAISNIPYTSDSPIFTATYTLQTSWTATPVGGSNTTAINFNFTLPLPEGYLDDLDISIINGADTGSFTKGNLTGSGALWTLYGTITQGGSIQIKIDKTGIQTGNKFLTIYGTFPVWTPVTGYTLFKPYGIAYGGGKFVSGGVTVTSPIDYKMAYSSDGMNWEVLPTYPMSSSAIYTISYGGGRFFVGGESGRVVNSTDGINWNGPYYPFSNYLVNVIAYSGTRYVAVGNMGRIAYSDNGTTWTSVTSYPFGTDVSASILHMAYGGSYFVVVITNGTMARSTNGTTWEVITNPFGTNLPYGIIYGGNRFVVWREGDIYYSSNGSSWTKVSNPPFGANPVYGITYGGGQFVAWSNNKFAWSANCINWDSESNFAFSDGYDSVITYGDNKYVIISTTGKIAYSPTE